MAISRDLSSLDSAVTSRAKSPLRPRSAWFRLGGVVAAVALLLLILVSVAVSTPSLQTRVFIAFAAASTGREVRIDSLRIAPRGPGLDVRFRGLHVGQPAWAPPGEMASVAEGHAVLAWGPLLRGRVALRILEVQGARLSLLRTVDGRTNWPIGRGKPLDLTTAGRVAIRDATLSARDKQHDLQLKAVANTDTAGRLIIQAQGMAHGQPLTLGFSGGALAGSGATKPYDFRADVGGEIHATLAGEMVGGLNLNQLRTAVTVQGQDLARLHGLTGLLAPNTPAYRISAIIVRDGPRLDVETISGRIGSTDVAGTVNLQDIDGVRVIRGELTSGTLDLADLRAGMGGAEGTARGRLLPVAKLHADRLQKVDLRVQYRAASVRRSVTGARSASALVTIKDGVLAISPAVLNLTRGRIEAKMRLDASGPTPHTEIDIRGIGIQLQDLKTPKGARLPAAGLLQGHIHLTGSGQSLRDAAAHASGVVELLVSRGSLDRTAALLLGGDVAGVIGGLFEYDQAQTVLYCAAAVFDVKDGVMVARNLMVDTDVAMARGSGQIDLRKEALSLRIEGHSKRRILAKDMPAILVGGTLMHPKPSVNPINVKLAAAGGLADKIIGPVARVFGAKPNAGPTAGGCR